MTEKKGHGSDTAKKANAKAAKDGEKNPRKSSAAQAELGKKGGKAAKHWSLAAAPSSRGLRLDSGALSGA